MRPRLALLVLGSLLAALASSCTQAMRDPVKLDFPEGRLDLRSWNFQTDGPVEPLGWLWDSDVLWSPEAGGRPTSLPPSQALGSPSQGGALIRTLMRSPWDEKPIALAQATVRFTALVQDHQNYGLQIGGIPGAFRVWVNGSLAWETGVLSVDPSLYRADGSGTVITVQPRNGEIDVVVQIVTSDPLVRHTELNRLWILGPAVPMMDGFREEGNWRSLQAAILLLGMVALIWLVRLKPNQKTWVYFIAFLGSCLAKILVNVEQPAPLLASTFPGVPISLYLFLNHGFNLIPFPLLVLFLTRQFPEDVKMRPFWVVLTITVVTTLWELAPFTVLAMGWEGMYSTIMGVPWSFVLNLYVILMTLFIFERVYSLFLKKRPLASALLWGGIGVGAVILIPVPLSYFIPVKFTFFMGWGLVFFLLAVEFELVRIQVRATDVELKDLHERMNRREGLCRFIDAGWASRLGRNSLEEVLPGDRQPAESVLVQIRSPDNPDLWLPIVGLAAKSRQGLLVEWKDGAATWSLDSWPETALAFALEIQAKLTGLHGLRFRIVLTSAIVEFRVLDAQTQWVPVVSDLPLRRLDELFLKAERYGAVLVLDSKIQDGLVIGGWRRHRHLTCDGTEIELYEAEEEALATLKDKGLDSFESALALARGGHTDEAIDTLVTVVRNNPFDQAARALLAEWGPSRNA